MGVAVKLVPNCAESWHNYQPSNLSGDNNEKANRNLHARPAAWHFSARVGDD